MLVFRANFPEPYRSHVLERLVFEGLTRGVDWVRVEERAVLVEESPAVHQVRAEWTAYLRNAALYRLELPDWSAAPALAATAVALEREWTVDTMSVRLACLDEEEVPSYLAMIRNSRGEDFAERVRVAAEGRRHIEQDAPRSPRP